MKLSQHFSLAEATYSATAISNGIENKPDKEQLVNLTYSASKMEVVRRILGNKPVQITSWLRVPELNRAVGGTPTSDHQTGASIDFKCPIFGSPRDICLKLMQHKEELGYDQLILEPTWVHISFPIGRSRGQELTYVKGGPFKKGIV
mgnify:FL=1